MDLKCTEESYLLTRNKLLFFFKGLECGSLAQWPKTISRPLRSRSCFRFQYVHLSCELTRTCSERKWLHSHILCVGRTPLCIIWWEGMHIYRPPVLSSVSCSQVRGDATQKQQREKKKKMIIQLCVSPAGFGCAALIRSRWEKHILHM